MAYIGNKLADSYTSFAKQDFTTSATTSYTLDYPVANANEIALFINFVRQEPTTAYTATGTSLTLTSATSASDDMYCVFLGKALQTVNPPAGSVGASQISDSSITLAKLSATGTKNSTTFLRGDNTFAEAGGGKILQVVQSAKTDTFSSASASWVDITDLSLNITPSSTSSKIFVTANFVTSHSAANSLGVRLMRDSTSIFAGDDTTTRVGTTSWQYVAGSNQNQGSNSFQYVDSPSTTSATTYKLQMWVTGGTGYLGQMEVDNNNTTYGRSASSIIAMEIGA